MVALKRLKLALRSREPPCPVVLSPTTVFTSRLYDVAVSTTQINVKATSQPTTSLTQLVKPAEWLLVAEKSISSRDSGECIDNQAAKQLTCPTTSKPTEFHDLPTEIHFQIAAFLPGHALHVLAWHGYTERLRCIYQAANPEVERLDVVELPAREKCIYDELQTRDAFERAPLPHPYANPVHKDIWATSWFYCASCEIASRCSHFPLKEMEESRERRTEMSKITDRKCFARISPVKLWDKKAVTWDQLQQAWTDMEGYSYTASSTLIKDHSFRSAKGKQIGRYTDVPNTLQLHDLDHALSRSPNNDSPREHGVEATADYYIDLYTLFRYSPIDGTSVITALTRAHAYICPHLDLPRLFARPMSASPIDFRPHEPEYSLSATVADVLCRTLEKGPWRADPACPGQQRQDRPERRIREQTIWCGFQGDRCRTAVCLQRFRDSSKGNSVGGLWGMSDLCRIRVVRKWRVDCGTGCEEWQAQNGVSMPAALRVL